MPLHADDRHALHTTRYARWAAAAEKHRTAERRALAGGNSARAAIARKAAEDAERHARDNLQRARRLEPHVPRARTARRLNEAAGAATLDRAVALAASTPHPVAIPPKEAKRQAKAAAKRERLGAQASQQRQRDEKTAQVDHDPRTAAAQREIQIRGPSIAKKASLTDYGSLIGRKQDRTGPRLAAMARFDELCHRAHAGLYPNPRFERGVDTSRGLPGVPDDRASSLQEMQRLTARIGEEAVAILFHRIFSGMTLAWMAGQGMGEPERLGVLFLSAVDATAWFYGLRPPAKSVSVMSLCLEAQQQ